MSSDEKATTKNFVITWTIENFHMYSQLSGARIISPTITLNSFLNTKWYLEVFPKGDYADTEECASCNFRREDSDEGPDSIEIDWILSANSADIGRKKDPFFKGSGCGTSIRRESILANNGILHITCHMIMSGDYSAVVKNKLKSSLVNSNSSEFDVKQFLGLPEKTLIYINQCSIHSKISAQNRSFICPINDFDLDGIKELDLPPLSFTEVGTFLPTMTLKNTKNGAIYLKTDIFFKEGRVENIFAICSVHILNSDGDECNSTEEKHLFLKERETDLWHFDHLFKWSDMKEYNNPHYLHFKFSISDGHILTDMKWLQNIDNPPDFPTLKSSPNDVMKELHRFYKQKKFCDITLRTNDGTFECHKAILCAMSPVFAAMFESGRKENDTNVVCIDDMDSDTISQMLNFMYTLRTPKFDFKSAKNLFSAADKYQIESLKRVCCTFLKVNLNEENVCEILCFADARNNEILKQSAAEYISIYRNDILFSEQWKELADKDLHLAYEILMELAPCNVYNFFKIK